jgi:phage tail protein X|tara:strand:+ start:289 stop:585 length:297 start_codon:yes stop_codon:yes gene_type:complete
MANSRYDNNKIQKLKDGRRVFRSRLYPNIPLSDKDIYIVTQTGDRLDSLANEYYGDSSLWWIIATANNLHDVTFAMPDGTTLRIPVNYSKIVNDFRKL